MAKTLSAVEKLDNTFIEEATPKDGQQEEVVVREFDPKFMRKTMRKVCCPRCIHMCATCTDSRSWT